MNMRRRLGFFVHSGTRRSSTFLCWFSVLVVGGSGATIFPGGRRAVSTHALCLDPRRPAVPVVASLRRVLANNLPGALPARPATQRMRVRVVLALGSGGLVQGALTRPP